MRMLRSWRIEYEGALKKGNTGYKSSSKCFHGMSAFVQHKGGKTRMNPPLKIFRAHAYYVTTGL